MSMKYTLPQNAKSTVLIADRELPIRAGLLTILADEPNLIVPPPASTISDLMAMARRQPSALIVMDTQFADGDGGDACRTLLSQHPGLRVLFLANHATPQHFMQAIDAGATGFLLKQVSRTELLGSIRLMLAGQSSFDPTLISATLKWIGEQQRSLATPLPRLSPRHQQMLPLLSEGLTNKEISTQLNLSEKTIKNYLADLFDRLQMSRRTQVAAWFISQSAQQLPRYDLPWSTLKIGKHRRNRALTIKESLHANSSRY